VTTSDARIVDTNRPVAVDASWLPNHAFGHHGVMWWGTVGLMAIEGMAFALTILMYVYVWTRLDAWPPDVLPPSLRFGTLNLAILVASLLPNAYTKRAAERYDLHGVRIGMTVCLAFGVAFIAVRVLEFTALNVSWDTNAYGSAVYLLLGLHTTHLVTDVMDTVVLAVLMFTGPLEKSRFVDVSENALYWYFVVAAWLPIYVVIYWLPRWL
jgi:heme/copper-type cytochrome/quinol oxidase subunit 3